MIYHCLVRRTDGRLINGSLEGLPRRPKDNLRYIGGHGLSLEPSIN